MTVTFRIRRGDAATWASVNPILALGEPALETDTRKVKYGDGLTAWNSLSYATISPATSGSSGSMSATDKTALDAQYTAWTAYTPTAHAGGGAWTSYSATGYYKQIGKTVFFSVTVTITANGTGGGYFVVTAPVAAVRAQTVMGMELAINSHVAAGSMQAGSTDIIVSKYDGSYLGGTGYVINLQGVYEAA